MQLLLQSLVSPQEPLTPPSVPSAYLGLSAAVWSLQAPGLEGTHGYSKRRLLQPPWLSGQGLPSAFGTHRWFYLSFALEMQVSSSLVSAFPGDCKYGRLVFFPDVKRVGLD